MYVLPVVALAAATAAPLELTLADAYRRARESAGAIRMGDASVEEARGRLIAARAPRDNPSLEAALGRRGNRSGAPEASARADLEVAVAQTLELGGKRGARVLSAAATVDRELAATADATRLFLRDVGLQFYEAARVGERSRLARAGEIAAHEMVRVARVRLRHGDVAVLDVHLAETVLARARASRINLDADQSAAVAALKGLLLIRPEEDVVPLVRVDLDALAPEMPAPSWTDVLAGRPDLNALAAAEREAQAQVRGARALRWPDATPQVRYSREEGVPVVWGGVSLTLPLSSRGTGERSASEARLRRTRVELEAARAGAEAELRSAHATYAARRDAARSLAEIIGSLDESLDLARRSYESGQIGLGDLLVVRRESLEARAEAMDLVFAAAAARVQLEAAMGVLR
jgi:cobalt-zinc-cadmium efflux system outer membrane protein